MCIKAPPSTRWHRFVKFGGGVSAAQLAWLQEQLEAAAAAGERVICCCHLCFHPATCSPVCLLWNYDQVLEVRGWVRLVDGCARTLPVCLLWGNQCWWGHGMPPFPCSTTVHAGMPALLTTICPMLQVLQSPCSTLPATAIPPPMLQVLQRYAGTVVATLAGHAHMDGMATDEAGIRHRVCKAVLETPPGRCV